MIINQKTENLRYAALQGCYMMMCAGFNFVTYYLLELKVSDRNIGIFIALCCLAAVAAQQYLGRMVDTGRLGGKRTILCLALVMCIIGSVLTFVRSGGPGSLLFGILMFCILAMQPILNAFAFYYRDAPTDDFVGRGFARLVSLAGSTHTLCPLLRGSLL